MIYEEENKMRKCHSRSAFVLSALMSLTLCGCSSEEQEPAETPQSDADAEIREAIAQMTLEQKLSQMMIPALRSDGVNTKTAVEINPDYADLIQKYDFGGMILFGGNIQNTAQTVQMIHDIQEAAMKSDNGIPMFLCVDQEGGLVNRVSFGTTSCGNMALAACGDVSLAEESARTLGEEINALGFNMNFAPVCDVNSNPANPVIGVRSFSDDPAVVSDYVKAFIKGLRSANISSALKHFPGHGNVGEDSHSHLPCSDFSLEEIRHCDLIPFAAGIEEGTDMIMTAHIQYPQIEKETYVSILDGKEIILPATLSRTIIHDLLREEMGYDGIIITDGMTMDAIVSHFDPVDAAVLAINAGVDILLCPVDLYKDDELDTLPKMDTYMANLVRRVEAGDVSMEEIDDSVFRILRLKKEKNLYRGMELPSVEEQTAKAEACVGTAEHHTREWQIAQAGMTLLKNENQALPLDGHSQTLILYPVKAREASVEYALTRLTKEGLIDPSMITCMYYEDVSADDNLLQEALGTAQAVVILSQSVSQNEEILKVIDQAKENGKKTILLSLKLPYDAACYENTDAVLCAYQPYGSAHDADGNGPFNLNVAVALCTAFGQSVPCGSLPVNVPKITTGSEGISFEDDYLYARGFGLSDWGK